jgi:hypothetical protein
MEFGEAPEGAVPRDVVGEEELEESCELSHCPATHDLVREGRVRGEPEHEKCKGVEFREAPAELGHVVVLTRRGGLVEAACTKQCGSWQELYELSHFPTPQDLIREGRGEVPSHGMLWERRNSRSRVS